MYNCLKLIQHNCLNVDWCCHSVLRHDNDHRGDRGGAMAANCSPCHAQLHLVCLGFRGKYRARRGLQHIGGIYHEPNELGGYWHHVHDRGGVGRREFVLSSRTTS